MKILFIILSFLALQTSTYSSTSANNKFNQKYLSNYFSALVSSGNQKNEEALEYFNSSKFLIQKHDNFLKKYVFSLVLNGQVKKGIDQIKISKNDINSNTFELNLLLLVDSLKKKDFKQANKRFKEFQFDKDDGTYEYVIYKILKDFIIKSKIMSGYHTPFTPGWDCHGLPIEWQIEEKYRKEGKNKETVGGYHS